MNKIVMIVCAIMFGCKSGSVKQMSVVDSLMFRERVDSMVKQTMQNVFLRDTVNLADAPVIVISAKPLKKDYSSYKDIRLGYKNVTKKTITAISFSWYGVTGFGEPAEMGGITEGIGAGFSDDNLAAGKTEYSTWPILSQNLKKVIKAWPTKVAFEDGSKWELKKTQKE